MSTKPHAIGVSAIILALGLAIPASPQSAKTKVEIGNTEASGRVNLPEFDNDNDREGVSDSDAEDAYDSDTNQEFGAQTSVIKGANKASKLVGMEVKNRQNKSLGKIKDVVIDLSSGRVSYAVLSNVDGQSGKMIAVPPRALSASDDGNHLVLNADVERLRESAGFTQNNWPNLNNPSWGAAFRNSGQFGESNQDSYNQYRDDSRFGAQNRNQNRDDFDPYESAFDYRNRSDIDRDAEQSPNRDRYQDPYRSTGQSRYGALNDSNQWRSNDRRPNVDRDRNQSSSSYQTERSYDPASQYRSDDTYRSDNVYRQNRSDAFNYDRNSQADRYDSRSSAYDYQYDRGNRNSYDYNDRGQPSRGAYQSETRREMDRGYAQRLYTPNQPYQNRENMSRYSDSNRSADRYSDQDAYSRSDYRNPRDSEIDRGYSQQLNQRYWNNRSQNQSDIDWDWERDSNRNARFQNERYNNEYDRDDREYQGRASYRLDNETRQRNQSFANDRQYREYDRNRFGSQIDEINENNLQTFKGSIVSVQPEEKTFKVKNENGSVKTFSIADQPTIRLRGNQHAQLVDLKVGYNVSVGYHQEDGEQCAHTIIRTDPSMSK